MLPVAIQTYALIEALFLAYQFWLCRIIQERNRLPVRDHDRTLELFNRALTFGLDVSLEGKPVPHTLTEEHESVASFREAFSAWFFNHPFKALSRDDVINWLAWSLLDLDAHDLDKQQRKLVEDCCDLVERRSAWTFKRAGGIGNDPKAKQGSHVKCIRLTIDRTLYFSRHALSADLQLTYPFSCANEDSAAGPIPRHCRLELAGAQNDLSDLQMHR